MTDEEVFSVVGEYRRWIMINSRCNNNPNYKNRNIKVCDEWKGKKGFVRYYQHVSQLPHFGETGYSLDRINNNKGYEPGNVRWADAKTQSNNRRNTIRDHGQTLQEISIETGISVVTLQSRWEIGDRGDQLRRPLGVVVNCKITDNGQTLNEIAKQTGITYNTIKRRYLDGDRGDRLRRPFRTKKDAYSNELTRFTSIEEDTTEKE